MKFGKKNKSGGLFAKYKKNSNTSNVDSEFELCEDDGLIADGNGSKKASVICYVVSAITGVLSAVATYWYIAYKYANYAAEVAQYQSGSLAEPPSWIGIIFADIGIIIFSACASGLVIVLETGIISFLLKESADKKNIIQTSVAIACLLWVGMLFVSFMVHIPTPFS